MSCFIHVCMYAYLSVSATFHTAKIHTTNVLYISIYIHTYICMYAYLSLSATFHTAKIHTTKCMSCLCASNKCTRMRMHVCLPCNWYVYACVVTSQLVYLYVSSSLCSVKLERPSHIHTSMRVCMRVCLPRNWYVCT